MDLPHSNGPSYQKRPPYFAMKYQRKLLTKGTLMEIKAAGFALCSMVVLTEDTKRYAEAPRFWTGQLLECLGIDSRTTLGTIRDRCVQAGVLHYEPGAKATSMTLWTLWPKSWEGLDAGAIDENAVQKLDSISNPIQNAVQKLDSICRILFKNWTAFGQDPGHILS